MKKSPVSDATPSKETIMPTDYRKTMEAVNALTEKYPFLSVSFIGTSILGRSIPMMTVGNEDSPTALYVGTHHGMEWMTAALLLRFAKDLCETVSSGAKIYRICPRSLLEARAVSIIPMLNPDGAELQIHGLKGDNIMKSRLLSMNGTTDFSRWQANARGVDLNHNYDCGFSEYKKLEKKSGIQGGCATRYSGEFPESEPETGALCNYIRWNKNIKGVLTLHTQGEEIYCGVGDSEKIRVMGKLIEKMTGYKLTVPEEMASYGGLTDWLVSKMNIPSFTLECGKGTNPLPKDCFFPIYTTLREALFTFPILI